MTSTLRVRSAAALLLCATALLAAGCAGKSINRVLSDPSRYRNEEVRLTGDVIDSYSIASTGAYQIDDGSGRLWVWSTGGVPRKGARVTVTGTIREGFNLGALGNLVKLPQGAVILIEREHRVR
jgi:hypothetical protein